MSCLMDELKPWTYVNGQKPFLIISTLLITLYLSNIALATWTRPPRPEAKPAAPRILQLLQVKATS